MNNSPLLGDHRADRAGAEVLGAGGGGGLWAGHRRQGNRLRRIFTEYLLVSEGSVLEELQEY